MLNTKAAKSAKEADSWCALRSSVPDRLGMGAAATSARPVLTESARVEAERHGAYLRYTDDFLLFGDDKARLWDLRPASSDSHPMIQAVVGSSSFRPRQPLPVEGQPRRNL